MNDEQRQEIIRRQSEGMRAISNEELARRQSEAAYGMRQRGPITAGEQEAMRNFCSAAFVASDETNKPAPEVPRLTLLERIKRWAGLE